VLVRTWGSRSNRATCSSHVEARPYLLGIRPPTPRPRETAPGPRLSLRVSGNSRPRPHRAPQTNSPVKTGKRPPVRAMTNFRRACERAREASGRRQARCQYHHNRVRSPWLLRTQNLSEFVGDRYFRDMVRHAIDARPKLAEMPKVSAVMSGHWVKVTEIRVRCDVQKASSDTMAPFAVALTFFNSSKTRSDPVCRFCITPLQKLAYDRHPSSCHHAKVSCSMTKRAGRC